MTATRSPAVASLFALALAGLLLSGCGGGGGSGGSTSTPASGAPVIASFTASPSGIASGETTTLSWSVSGATSLSIAPGVGPVTGSSTTVRPTTTTTYTLTASNGTGSTLATTRVTVAPAPVAAVTVSLQSTTLSPGLSTLALATLKDAAGNTLSDRAATWTTSDGSVATVSAVGYLTAQGVGTTIVTATSEGVSGAATLSVFAVPVASFRFTIGTDSLQVGQTTQAIGESRDAGGNLLTGRSVRWSSGNASVVTVSDSGLVTAVGAGNTPVQGDCEGMSHVIWVNVAPPPVAAVTVNLGAVTLVVGQTTQATAVLADAGGNVLTGRSLSWTTSDGSVASVFPDGTVTARGAGMATITARSEGVSGSSTVVVSPGGGGGSVGGTSSPSVAAGTGQTVTAGVAGVGHVTLPGASVLGPGTLTVTQLLDDPTGGVGPGRMVSGMSISMSGQPAEIFPVPATITFLVDPSRLRSDVPAGEAAWVAYRDEDTGALIEVPALVDAVAGTVSVETKHFSYWILEVLGPDDIFFSDPHFTYRAPANLNVRAWGSNDVNEVMARIHGVLFDAFNAYAGAGFTAPVAKIPVELVDDASSRGSAYQVGSGKILVSSQVYANDMKVFEQELVHELFHVFQRVAADAAPGLLVSGARNMNSCRWFVEAAADYAAWKYACTTCKPDYRLDGFQNAEVTRAPWVELPLWTVNDTHEYQTSEFLSWFISNRGTNLKTLQDKMFSVTHFGDPRGGAGYFLTLASTTGGPGARNLLDFVTWLETSRSSPLGSMPLGDTSAYWGYQLYRPFEGGVGYFDSSRYIDGPGDARSLALAISGIPEDRELRWRYGAKANNPFEGAANWEVVDPPLMDVRILRTGDKGAADIPGTDRIMVKNGDIAYFAWATNVPEPLQMLNAHVELEPEPHPDSRFAGVQYATLPNTFGNVEVHCSASVAMTLPGDATVVTEATGATGCDNSPLMCQALTLTIRYVAVPNRNIDVLLTSAVPDDAVYQYADLDRNGVGTIRHVRIEPGQPVRSPTTTSLPLVKSMPDVTFNAWAPVTVKSQVETIDAQGRSTFGPLQVSSENPCEARLTLKFEQVPFAH